MMAFWVSGTPGPQGSKRHVGGGRLIESSKKVAPWRAAVRAAAMEAKTEEFQPWAGAVRLRVHFYLRKPQKPKADRPITYPDSSKLLRSTEDALTEAGIWLDDGQVVSTEVEKFYAESEDETGAVIEVQGWK